VKESSVLAVASFVLLVTVLVVPFQAVQPRPYELKPGEVRGVGSPIASRMYQDPGDPPGIYRTKEGGVTIVWDLRKPVTYNEFLLANQWILLASIMLAGLAVGSGVLGTRQSIPKRVEPRETMKPVESAPAREIHEENMERLIDYYRLKYPHNPNGLLEFHIYRIERQGKTRQEAEQELAKQLGIPWETPRPVEVVARTKYCPDCKLILPLDAKHCPRCGKDQYYFG